MAGGRDKKKGDIGEKGVGGDTGVSLTMLHLAPIVEQQDCVPQEIIVDLSGNDPSLPDLLYSKNPVICNKGIDAAVHNESTSLPSVLDRKNPGVCNEENNAAVGNDKGIFTEVVKEKLLQMTTKPSQFVGHTLKGWRGWMRVRFTT
jgi:hypothetical protein